MEVVKNSDSRINFGGIIGGCDFDIEADANVNDSKDKINFELLRILRVESIMVL